MNINDIIIGDRFRKDINNIDGLAGSINRVGLLHPIVINKQNNLVCGQRRLKALEKNDITNLIENKHYRVIDLDIDKLVRGEYDENVFRQDFLPSEKVSIINKVMEIEKPKAKERQLSTLKKGAEPATGISRDGIKGEAKELASKPFGWSRKTYEKAKMVLEYEPENEEDLDFKEELVILMDKDKSVDKAYKTLKQKTDNDRIKKETPVKKLQGKYKTIVIDPPWETKSEIVTRINPDYSQMSTTEIKDFLEKEIKPHIDDNAHIYLWTINNRLHESFHLLEELGFEYKNIITWCKISKEGKPAIGVGGNFRNATEHILFAVKGSLPLKQQNLPTWFAAQKTTHSTKPDEAYNLIEIASHPPYLDIFARKKRKNWEVMGDING